jgi:hypothetical protein
MEVKVLVLAHLLYILPLNGRESNKKLDIDKTRSLGYTVAEEIDGTNIWEYNRYHEDVKLSFAKHSPNCYEFALYLARGICLMTFCHGFSD